MKGNNSLNRATYTEAFDLKYEAQDAGDADILCCNIPCFCITMFMILDVTYFLHHYFL